MNKQEIAFNTNDDIIMQIEMLSFMAYNDQIAYANEHIGDIYSFKDIEDMESLQEHYEKQLSYKAIEQLQKENKQLKELIDVILNWNIFNGECPMNFGYDKNTIEEKSQEVFYQEDDYCENNCNEDYKKCWLKYFRKMQELEKGSEE